MKKKIKVLIVLILIIPFVIIGWKYKKYKDEAVEQPPYFDLFITETFFQNFNESPWGEIDTLSKRPIEWLINKKEFEKLDSIYLGFKNISNEKMYYRTWGEANSRIRESFVIYKNGEIDSIPFGGFGCGTGIFLTPIKNGKIAGSKILNPLMFNPYTGYHLPLKNENFPKLFKKIYGDSVVIKFEQVTFSLPWNKYPSQMIESKEIVISTKKIIENWKKGDFRLNPEFEKEYELSFYVNEVK